MSAKVGVMAWQRPHLICSSTGSTRCSEACSSASEDLQDKEHLCQEQEGFSKSRRSRVNVCYLLFYRHVFFMLTDGWLNGEYYPVYLSQMAEVDTHIAK